ncbi:hypothetical protein FHW17_004016 [Phyllobacterium sp. P30BS-XVII]|nr:hypothetical protein [Phyllobacterium sp. P30BS-XVII]
MPEASMDKNDGPVPGKDEVWLAWEGPVVEAKPQSSRMQGLAQP